MNRFDSPKGQQYVSTRVPLPLEFIAGMAKDYSDKYAAGQDSANKLSDMVVTKYAPIHQDLAKSYNEKVKKSISDLVESTKPEEWAKPEFQYKVNRIKQNLLQDPDLQKLNNTYNVWNKEIVPFINDPKNSEALIYDINQNPDGSYKQTTNDISKLRFTPKGDRYGKAEKIIGGIASDASLRDLGYDFTKMQKAGPNNEYQVYNKITKKWEGLSTGKLKSVVNNSIELYAQEPEGTHHLQEILRPYIGDKAYGMTYNDLKRNAAREEDKEGIYHTLLNGVNDTFGEYLLKTGFKQLYNKSEKITENKVLDDALTHYKLTHPENNDFQNLGSTEGNISTTPVTNGSALSALGATEGIFDEDGNINYKSGGVTKENQNIANKAYSDLVQIATNSGFDLKSYTKDGKIDYDSLKKDLINYGKNISKETAVIHNLQKDFQNNLTEDVFGKFNADGKIIKSGTMQGIKMYENNNPNNVVSEDNKKDIAKTAKFVGIDFNDNNLGALMFTAIPDGQDKSKFYNAIINNDVLKTYMEPVHTLTQEAKKAKSGKISYETSQANVKTYSETLSQIANNVLNSGDPNAQAKVNRIIELSNAMNNSSDKTIRVITGSNPRNNTLYIGKIVKSNDNKTKEEFFQIDNRGNITGPVSLGSIQHEESTEIQRLLSSGVDESSEVIDPKNVSYK